MTRTAITTQFQILKELVWSPREAFETISTRAPYFLPLLIIGIGGIAITLMTIPLTAQVARHNLSGELAPEKIDEALQFLVRWQMIGALLIPLTIVLRWAIVAGLIFLTLQLVDGKMLYRQAFSLVAFASIFLFIESCQTLVILKLRAIQEFQNPLDLQPAVGLNLLFPQAGSIWYQFLNNINPLQVWYVAILIWGVSTLNGFSRKKASAVVVPVWLFLVTVQVALATVSESM